MAAAPSGTRRAANRIMDLSVSREDRDPERGRSRAEVRKPSVRATLRRPAHKRPAPASTGSAPLRPVPGIFPSLCMPCSPTT